MNAEDYAALPTERLLEMFVAAAKQMKIGSRQLAALESLRDPLAPSVEPTDVETLKPPAAQLWAVSLALVPRQPTVEVERMLKDADPDIRMTAAGFLGSLSPELADAATKGAQAMRSTEEVLALQRRARQPPPQKPPLDEMTDDMLVARFEDAALRESGVNYLDCIENEADADLRHDIVGEVWDLMRRLKARGLLARLIPLFANKNQTVRREAATACLRIAEPEAIAVLEDVARNGIYGDGFEARLALSRWRKDQSIVYGM
jgi:hypothetical protein